MNVGVVSPLAAWLDAQIGRGRRFESMRQLSLMAGLSQNTLGLILSRGKADPESLKKLAITLEVPVGQLFVLAGWLEAGDFQTSLSSDEMALVDAYRQVPSERRRLLIEVAEGLRG